MSKLPKYLEYKKEPDPPVERLVSDMEIGEKAYVVSWAMEVDLDRVLYMRLHHTIYNTPHGTAHLLIERTKTGFNVYESIIKEFRYFIRNVVKHNTLPVTLV